ncbi:MAG: phosphotransferase [Polyangiaceae bacterium]|nr:phosphotransferase [Polyangiaceae bacterium]
MEGALRGWLEQATGAKRIDRLERIQSLWGGYGELYRAHLTGAAVETAIVKWVRPPARRGGDASHRRKCRSYDVETAFYRVYASRCGDEARVATAFGQRARENEWLLALEDLDAAGYPRRIRDPRGAELEACLAWLAAFHARFMSTSPDGLWSEGTYWHLATRQDELEAIRGTALFDRAPELDRRLRQAHHRSFVHGDAKPANFCFSADGRRVAAVDFQYVGGGSGMRDVAYLLHGSASGAAERRALDFYFEHLRASLAPLPFDAVGVEEEWRELYAAAGSDFDRFLAGWRM